MKRTLVGVISDTHGLLRSQVFRVFRDVDLILHAGDIGSPEILKNLRSVAPVIAVRGNNDKGAWADRIPERKTTTVGDLRIYLIHDLKEIDIDPSGYDAVVTGHSHRPSVERRDGILFLNPGSAGPRRFKLPISIARLTVRGGDMKVRLIELRNAI
jgi:putative phosphoesterase